MATEQFIMQWDEGKDNFAVDPPNATVSVLGGDGSDVSDAVVTLKTPKLDGTTLTFDITILEGTLSGVSGPAALFIDHFGGGGGFGGGGFGGFHGGGSFAGGGFHGGDFGGGNFRGDFRGDDVHIGDTNINRVGGKLLARTRLPRRLVSRCSGRRGRGRRRRYWGRCSPPLLPYYNSYYNDQQCGYYPYPPC